MIKRIALFIGLLTNLVLQIACTSVTATLAGWNGARMNISSPANLGTTSVYGLTWCTGPDRICQKSLRTTELKPGTLPAGGGYSVSPSNNIRVPKHIEVTWYDAQGEKHQQVVKLNIPGQDEVIKRYGAPRSTRGRFWDIVLIFKDKEPITYAWLLSDASGFTPSSRTVELRVISFV
ncbi:MAG: hypothetical protein AB2598_19970 [Candidatus Thiodiazotropha sp.]